MLKIVLAKTPQTMEILLFKANIDHSRPWGGRKLLALKGIESPAELTAGESWEVSVNSQLPSVIAGGAYDGQLLSDLVARMPNEILGQKLINRYGPVFPVLLKLLDANEHLSVQVHPPTAYAQEKHGDAFGKEEAWYVLPGSEDGILYLGLAAGVKLKDFEAIIRSGAEFELSQVMNEVRVQPGQCFFLETGTLHALGKGTQIVEIQRDSNRTYRVYDFNRKGNDGKLRELHLNDAFAVIDDHLNGQAALDHIRCSTSQISKHEWAHLPKNSSHFQLSTVKFKANQKVEIEDRQSFVTVTALTDLQVHTTGSTPLKKGFSALVPACCQGFSLSAPSSGEALLTWVP